MGIRLAAVKSAKRSNFIANKASSGNMNDDLPAVLFAIFVSLAVIVLLFCWIATCVSLVFGRTYHQRRRSRVASLRYLGWTMEVERSGSVARIRKDDFSISNCPSIHERPRSLHLSPSAPNLIELPPTSSQVPQPPQVVDTTETGQIIVKPVVNANPPDYEPPPTYSQCVRSVRFANVHEV